MAPRNAVKKNLGKSPITTSSKQDSYATAREDQLKALSRLIADQAPLPLKAKIQWIVQAVLTLILASFFATVSHASLSPVYGEIPSGLYHFQLGAVAFLLGWALQVPTRQLGLTGITISAIPLIAAGTPLLQFYLAKQSILLGPIYGPLVTELLTFFPLLLMSITVVASPVQIVQIPGSEHLTSAAHAAMGAVLFSIFNFLQNFWRSQILLYVGKSVVFSRVVLQYIASGLYAILFPSKSLLFALPSLLHLVFVNVHAPFPFTTNLLQNSLQAHSEYVMLARQESTTGYISVLENQSKNFRVLRCDHSLLGGIWTAPPGGPDYKPKVREPVYAIFSMTEAVRLAKNKPAPETTENCLIIGLGIGTSTAAMVAHGIDTTVVEIDPVVHDFAVKYFDLPSNHTPVIQDAVEFVSHAPRHGDKGSYDYIVHDVFTGGAEPADLFTFEFLSGLHALLRPDGIIAIVYAGDLYLKPVRLVMRTIRSIFFNCRVFREDEGPEPPITSDFTNIVIFCSKASSKLHFRSPEEADYLGSYSRKTYLAPKHEVDDSIFARRSNDDEDEDIIRRDTVDLLKEGQKRSAIGHWGIMRTVMPDFVWQSW